LPVDFCDRYTFRVKTHGPVGVYYIEIEMALYSLWTLQYYINEKAKEFLVEKGQAQIRLSSRLLLFGTLFVLAV